MTLERGLVAWAIVLMHLRSPQPLMAASPEFAQTPPLTPVVDPGEIVGFDIPIPQSDLRPAQGDVEQRFAYISAFAADARPVFWHGLLEGAHGPDNEGAKQLIGPPQYH